MISRIIVRYLRPNTPRVKVPTTNLIEKAPKSSKGRFWRQGKDLVKRHGTSFIMLRLVVNISCFSVLTKAYLDWIPSGHIHDLVELIKKFADESYIQSLLDGEYDFGNGVSVTGEVGARFALSQVIFLLIFIPRNALAVWMMYNIANGPNYNAVRFRRTSIAYGIFAFIGAFLTIQTVLLKHTSMADFAAKIGYEFEHHLKTISLRGVNILTKFWILSNSNVEMDRRHSSKVRGRREIKGRN